MLMKIQKISKNQYMVKFQNDLKNYKISKSSRAN